MDSLHIFPRLQVPLVDSRCLVVATIGPGREPPTAGLPLDSPQSCRQPMGLDIGLVRMVTAFRGGRSSSASAVGNRPSTRDLAGRDGLTDHERRTFGQPPGIGGFARFGDTKEAGLDISDSLSSEDQGAWFSSPLTRRSPSSYSRRRNRSTVIPSCSPPSRSMST